MLTPGATTSGFSRALSGVGPCALKDAILGISPVAITAGSLLSTSCGAGTVRASAITASTSETVARRIGTAAFFTGVR